jgi:hypothetical protein
MKDVALPLFRCSLGVLGYGRLHHVEGQVLLLASERGREYPVPDASEFCDLFALLFINEDGARGVR